MNDSKYGRLYPERAVLPIRRLCENLLASIVGSQTAQQTMVQASALRRALNDLDALGFPPDEPLFLLRGQDELAPDTVRAYIDLIEQSLGAFGGIAKQTKVIEHLYEFAALMEAWEPRKLPD